MRTHAFRVYEPGGPSAMKWEEFELPDPGPDEVLIRHTSVGFNVVDTRFRDGTRKVSYRPFGIGVEGAGVIEAVGSGVKNFKPGDRVAYASNGEPGSYSEARVRTTTGLVKVPSWLDDNSAGAILSSGRTAEYMFNVTHKLKAGETILFHGASGGVGLFACQMAKAIGAVMIGVVSSDEKARVAKRFGCKHVVVTKDENDIIREVMRITKGAGVDVVYDSVGKDYWRSTLDCIRRRGLIVSFGVASGAPEIHRRDLAPKSVFLTHPSTNNYMATEEDRTRSTRNLLKMIRSGAVKVPIHQTYPLRDAPKVHEARAARQTTGVTIMLP